MHNSNLNKPTPFQSPVLHKTYQAKWYQVILTLICIQLILTACQPSVNTEESQEYTRPAKDILSHIFQPTASDFDILDSKQVSQSMDDEYNCVRSKPSPALNANTVKSHNFERINDYEAQEIAVLESGDSLIVLHSGCEYFMQTYRIFTSAAIPASKSDKKTWYKFAAEQLQQVKQADVSPVNIEEGIKVLLNYSESENSIQYQIEIDINDEGLPSVVKLEEPEIADHGKVILNVTFFIGPL